MLKLVHQTPLDAMFESFWSGMLIVVPAVLAELFLSLVALVAYSMLFGTKLQTNNASSGNMIMDTIEKMPLPGKIFFCFYNSFVVAAFVEEICKYVTIRRMQNRNEVSHPLHMVIYGAASGLGFATVENVMYVLMPILAIAIKGGSAITLDETQISQGVITSIFRTVIAIPVHMLFAMISATRVARSKFLRDKATWVSHVSISILLHGLYDVILFLAGILVPEEEGQVNWMQIVAFLLSILVALLSALIAFVQYRLLVKRYMGAIDAADYAGVSQLDEQEDDDDADDGVPIVTVDIEDEDNDEIALDANSKQQTKKTSSEKRE